MVHDRFQNIAPGTGGDIQQVHCRLPAVNLGDRPIEHLSQVRLTDANAAPSGAVEVHAIDEHSHRVGALGLIAVDMVERLPRVEPGLPADPDSPAQSADRPQKEPLSPKVPSAWRERGKRHAQAIVDVLRVAGPVGMNQADCFRWRIVALAEELPRATNGKHPVYFPERRMEKSGVELPLFD